MSMFKKIKEKYDDFILDHPKLKTVIQYIFIFLGTIVSAFCIAYAFRALISPKAAIVTFDESGNMSTNYYNLIGGGVPGLTQVIEISLSKLGIDLGIPSETLQSILYFGCNLPLFVFAYFKVGKRFAILTLINTLLTSLFINIIPHELTDIFSIKNDLLARAIFAGVINGAGIAIASELDHSTGGTDIVSTYFGMKKGKSIGGYVFVINSIIVVAYALIASIDTGKSPNVEGAATMALYTLIFFYASSLIVDKLTSRHKKVELQIITKEPKLAKVLIQTFPHGCTIVDAKGAYYDTDKKLILTVISSFELKKAIKIIYKVDSSAFVTVKNADKVYGKFFIKPIK